MESYDVSLGGAQTSKDEIRDRVIAGVRKLEKFGIPGAGTTKKDKSKVRCFSCFSSDEPCKGAHLSFKRRPECLLEPRPCPDHQ